MKKIERILSVIVLLLENEILSTAKLAERFNVSKRTIFRDIETIENAGFPIISVPGSKGGFSLLPSFKLRTLTYNNKEKQDILTAINVKDELLGITNQQSTIKEKISLMYEGNDSQPNQFSVKSPTVHRPEIEKSIQQKLGTIESSLRNNEKLGIVYVDSYGNFTKRTVHPYELSLLNGSWYLFAFCETREDFRYFKITRIRQIENLKTVFKKTIVTNKKWLQSENMIVQLKFKRESLGMLYDYYLEEEIEVQENHIIVSFHSLNLFTILPQLLVFGNDVQVIHPPMLRKQHKLIIENLAKTYK
ncbi:YafY family transcriptional regulator [Lysinibacillus agricola]|uniref:YafY family transcriptional regulator n=1 Tax=Lysinibacillus agricola TaxID=2590012 RepID=A0ABX7APE1_9BACI|nr:MULTISPECIES: YafY family protein [Lysinibacillus]KOS64489.1 hypothetical protein AN161_02050 [Lysinibacillus sp. FJAT-14222]QQP11646.1 YafY family transcriptional regulator [Lysinibacillus agricola]